MEISFYSHLESNTVIATFFTWHDSCTVVACEKIFEIWWPAMELQQGEVSIEFELRAKNRHWNGPLVTANLSHHLVTAGPKTCLSMTVRREQYYDILNMYSWGVNKWLNIFKPDISSSFLMDKMLNKQGGQIWIRISLNQVMSCKDIKIEG